MALGAACSVGVGRGHPQDPLPSSAEALSNSMGEMGRDVGGGMGGGEWGGTGGGEVGGDMGGEMGMGGRQGTKGKQLQGQAWLYMSQPTAAQP